MRVYPAFEDLGLDSDADRTEDLRPTKSEAPEVAASEASEPTLTRK
jgi:hypothetical protein